MKVRLMLFIAAILALCGACDQNDLFDMADRAISEDYVVVSFRLDPPEGGTVSGYRHGEELRIPFNGVDYPTFLLIPEPAEGYSQLHMTFDTDMPHENEIGTSNGQMGYSLTFKGPGRAVLFFTFSKNDSTD